MRPVMSRTSRTTHQTAGYSTTFSTRRMPAKASAKRFGFFLATIFGIVSPKMMMSSVVTTVAAVAQAPSGAASRTEIRMAMTDEIVEAAMLTRLFPMRMVERAVS